MLTSNSRLIARTLAVVAALSIGGIRIPLASAAGGFFVGGGYNTLYFNNGDHYCDEVHWTATYTINGMISQFHPFAFKGQYSLTYVDNGEIDSLGNTKTVYGDYYINRSDMNPSCH